MSCALGISMILSHFITSQRTRATRVLALSFMNRITAVIGAVGEGHVRVVQVAVVIGLHAVGARNSLVSAVRPSVRIFRRFVGLAPAGGRAAVEHRHPHQFAHRRQAEDAQFAGLARRPEAVVFVQLAGLELNLAAASTACFARSPACRRCRCRPAWRRSRSRRAGRDGSDRLF